MVGLTHFCFAENIINVVHLSISALLPSMHNGESTSDKLLHEGSSEDYAIDGDNYPDDYIADNEDMDFPIPYDDIDMSKLSRIKRDKYAKDTLQTVLYFKPSDDGVARFIVYTQTRRPHGKIELVSNVGVYDSEEEDSADVDAAKTYMPSKKLEHVSEKLKYVDNAAETDKPSNNLDDEDVNDKLKYIDNRGKDNLPDGDSHHAQSLVADGSEDSSEGVDKEDEQKESEYDYTDEDNDSSEDDARLEKLIIEDYGSADYFNNDYGHGEDEEYAMDNDFVEKPGRSEHSETEQTDVHDSSHVVGGEAPDAYTEEVYKEDGIVVKIVDDEGDDEMDDEDDGDGEYDDEGEHDDEDDSEEEDGDEEYDEDGEVEDEEGEDEEDNVSGKGEYKEGEDDEEDNEDEENEYEEEEDEDSSEDSTASVEGHEINDHRDQDDDRGDMIFKGIVEWNEGGPDSVSETSDTGEQTFTWQEGMTDQSIDETVDVGVPHEDLDLSKVRSASQQSQDDYTLPNRKPDDNSIEQINVYTHSDEHATVVKNNNKMWKVDEKQEEEEKRPKAVMSTDSKEGTVVDGKNAVSEFFGSKLKLPCWHCVSLCQVVLCCSCYWFVSSFQLMTTTFKRLLGYFFAHLKSALH